MSLNKMALAMGEGGQVRGTEHSSNAEGSG